MPEATPLKSFFVRDITVTPDIIAQIIGVPNVGADIFSEHLASYQSYDQGESPASASRLIHGSSDPTLVESEFFAHLAFLPRCIARILGGSIFSKAGNRDKTAGCHKLLTYLLLKKIKVNLPLLLFKGIWHGTHYGRKVYPHGTLISSLLAQHGLDLSTFPETSRLESFSQKNLSLMDYKAQGEPLTLETPLPRPVPSRSTRATSAAGPSSSLPRTSASPAPSTGPSMVIPSSGPPPQSQAPATSAPESTYPDLLSILPLFSLVPTHRVSLREALPLLQNSLLGMLNDNIRSHNETREALFSGLGLPPLPPRPLYTSPYETSTVSSRPAVSTPPPPPPPPSPPTTQTPAPSETDFGTSRDIITSADLSRALDAITLPAIDSEFAALSEIISDMATSSRIVASTEVETSDPIPEDAPIGTIRLVTSSTLSPVLTYSEVVTTSAVIDTGTSTTVPDPPQLSTPAPDVSSTTPPVGTSPALPLVVPYSDSDSADSS